MKRLAELINEEESALPFVQELAAQVPGRCVILPPSFTSGEVLVQTQVTTRSPMGAIAYHTGGIFIDHWIRILGSGSDRIERTLPGWNAGRSHGFYLVGDDAAGGFFAIDGDGLGFGQSKVCYWSPDSLEWENLDCSYTDFLSWAMTGDLDTFYSSLRWTTWKIDTVSLHGDRCYSFYPFLWTKEGSPERSHRGTIPVSEAFDVKVDIIRQLAQP